MALDKDGNQNSAYYDTSGGVHEAHSTGGKPWTVTDLGTTSGAQAGQPDTRWSTGITVDDKGMHYVTWADTRASRIMVATDQDGRFKAQPPVDGSVGGANPSIAVSGDARKQAVAWFDVTNANLDVASTSTGGLVLAFPLPTLGPPTGVVVPTGPTPACQPSGSSTTLQIAAPVGAATNGFDKTCLAVAAGKAFKVDFTNSDQDSIVHNWALFTDSSGSSQLGGGTTSEPVSPGQTQSYSIKALPAGQYFYRCDFHPTTMTGTFVAAKP